MHTWQQLFIDRTLTDVEYARNNPNSTDALKGALNAWDLNRYSNCLYYILENNFPVGFNGTAFNYPLPVPLDAWEFYSFFHYADVNAYEAALYKLKDIYALQFFFPNVNFGIMELYGNTNRRNLDYVKINQWELILYYLGLFVLFNARTWQQVADNYNTWNDVYLNNSTWGNLLI